MRSIFAKVGIKKSFGSKKKRLNLRGEKVILILCVWLKKLFPINTFLKLLFLSFLEMFGSGYKSKVNGSDFFVKFLFAFTVQAR